MNVFSYHKTYIYKYKIQTRALWFYTSGRYSRAKQWKWLAKKAWSEVGDSEVEIYQEKDEHDAHRYCPIKSKIKSVHIWHCGHLYKVWRKFLKAL